MTRYRSIILCLLLLSYIPVNMMAQKRLTLEDLNFGGVNYASMSPVRKHYKWKGNELIESEEKEREVSDADSN